MKNLINKEESIIEAAMNDVLEAYRIECFPANSRKLEAIEKSAHELDTYAYILGRAMQQKGCKVTVLAGKDNVGYYNARNREIVTYSRSFYPMAAMAALFVCDAYVDRFGLWDNFERAVISEYVAAVLCELCNCEGFEKMSYDYINAYSMLFGKNPLAPFAVIEYDFEKIVRIVEFIVGANKNTEIIFKY